MTTEIKLDTQAVNALFPEGTEARVNLQNCVLANIARSNLEKYVNLEMLSVIQSEATRVTPPIHAGVKSAIEEYIVRSGYWSKDIDLKESAYAEISKTVRIIVNNEIKLKIKEEIDKAYKDAVSSLKSEVLSAIDNSLKVFTKESVDAEVRKRLRAIQSKISSEI